MAGYLILPGGAICRDTDGALIPADPANLDYQAYLAWRASGARRITGEAFLRLFTVAEVGAMTAADPHLLVGAFKVAANGGCNLDSPECAALLAIAIQKGALAAERKAQILAGQVPP